MKIRRILCLPVLLIVLSVSYAQTGKLFSVDKELSSSMVHYVFQDRYGVIWIATEDGLNRYDGSKFTVYKNSKQDSTSALSDFSGRLFEDSRGNLYVGFRNGLQIYDHGAEKFRKIPLILENGEEVVAFVMSILERRNGDILIATSGHGLFRLIDNEGERIRADQNSKLIPSYYITNIYEDKHSGLWASTQDKGLFYLNNRGSLKNYCVSEEFDGNNITSVCEDKEGNLYIGNRSTGMYAYNGDKDTFVSIHHDGSPLAINTLYTSASGEIFIGTEGEGLKLFNPATKEITEGNFNAATFDISKSKINSIMEDESGNIWLGVYQKGVVLLPARRNNFRYLGYRSIKNNVIGSHSITSVFKDHKGFLWVGSDGDGVYKLSPGGEQLAHFKPNENKSESVPSAIMTIFEDSNHDLWLGSYDKGLCKIDRNTGQCEYVNDMLESNITQSPRIFNITEDRDKNLWVAAMGSGIYCLNLETYHVDHYNALSGPEYRPEKNVLHNSWASSLLVTKNNNLVIGTADGIGFLDLKTRSFVSTVGVNRLLPGYAVHCLYEDNQGTLWIGSAEGLLYKEPGSLTISAYTTDDGLPSNIVCAIQGDEQNNLWISTSSGISKLNPETDNIINYYTDDGLQGNEFNKRATFADKQGQIYFAGINGVTYFTPSEITDKGRKLDVHFTGFYIHDQAVKKGMKSGSYDIVDSPTLEAKIFHLAHKDNSFTIEFSAMEYSNPERITYMYSLEDGDSWIPLRPGANNVTFNDLSPGDYNFKILAKDYNTFSEPNQIQVSIHPAWYFSSWAKFIYFLIVALAVYVVVAQIRHRIRTRRKLLEHMHTEEINKAKLQFFTNISHEIRTPMSLLMNPLKKLIASDKNPDRQKTYYIMQRNSDRIINLINQLMDIRKIDSGQMLLKFEEVEIVALIKDICALFEDQAISKHIKFHFHHDVEELYAWVDPKNFDKIIINIVSNAFKNTGEHGKIDIHLRKRVEENAENELYHSFEIIISDNGTGIDESETERIFEQFYQSRKNGNASKEGVGIGLHLTRSLVELHHGTIRVESPKEEAGCRFIIHLPLGNDHLKEEEIEEVKTPCDNVDLVTEEFSEEQDVSESKVKSRTRFNILVVDDDEEIRKFIREELARDYHVWECINGKEALATILKKKPDIVISDVIMPEMDGITLVSKIRQNININDIPIVLLTGKSSDEDTLEGLSIGADTYLTKPFNIDILRKTIQNLIKSRIMLRNKFTGNQQQEERVKKITLKSTDEKLLERVMDFINKNISNSDLNVEMLANGVGISRVHLHRKLKELTNQSSRDLIRNIRLKQAGELLASKHLAVSEVAYATGFTNLTYFSNAFKDFYGVPPTTFKEKAQLKQRESAEENRQ